MPFFGLPYDFTLCLFTIVAVQLRAVGAAKGIAQSQSLAPFFSSLYFVLSQLVHLEPRLSFGKLSQNLLCFRPSSDLHEH